MPTDTELLDLLELAATPGLRWIARPSTTGRGYRLHQATDRECLSFGSVGYTTAREALLAFYERHVHVDGVKL